MLRTIQPSKRRLPRSDAADELRHDEPSRRWAGRRTSVTSARAREFLRTSVRPDGSWPIDTNLATWVTTLAVKRSPQPGVSDSRARMTLREWLLGQQYRERTSLHPAAPGGWAWTDLPGGVPDADDTPGALLALLALAPWTAETARAGEAGVRWLLDLQNRDGGIPTFCRGWGTLPFDRSRPDLTAHTLARVERVAAATGRRAPKSAHAPRHRSRGFVYLAQVQRADGSWLPLWFGNQHAPDDENPTYGTARVLACANSRARH